MKKILTLLLASVLCFALCACENANETNENQENNESGHTVNIKLSEDNLSAFMTDVKNINLRSCNQYLYIFENQLATASYNGISHYIDQLQALNMDNLYIDILSSEYSLIETDNMSDLEKDLLQLIPMEMFFQEQYDMNASNITNVWCVGYDDNGNANNLLPKNARILWVKDEINTSTIGFIAYEDNGQTFYDYAYFNDDAMSHLNGIEKSSSSGKCVYTESRYLFFSNELHGIIEATDGMEYVSISVEETENILSKGRNFYEILNYYRDEYWFNINIERQEKETENNQSEDPKNAKPSIGMTKDQVLNGAWGAPDRKNIDEFAWGTHEQWVYDNLGYVYFENGIVTSISRSE